MRTLTAMLVIVYAFAIFAWCRCAWTARHAEWEVWMIMAFGSIVPGAVLAGLLMERHER